MPGPPSRRPAGRWRRPAATSPAARTGPRQVAEPPPRPTPTAAPASRRAGWRAASPLRAAFAYDEDALPVVAVTPRGAGWRRANRLGVTLVPLSAWALVVALRPGEVPFWRPAG